MCPIPVAICSSCRAREAAFEDEVLANLAYTVLLKKRLPDFTTAAQPNTGFASCYKECVAAGMA
ncbi:hypothetical protein BK663_25555 [Pseudomonas lini]|uniref:Uncharacterized protein n=1 Tax=Pseudomonas lini TaxID=163011 RepID=A0A423IAL5_9PSED|nr:hypothetical protein BK663_25555 [Pseudomonas lini]